MKEVRYDHKEHVSRRGKLIPASFDIYYIEGGVEIAWYNSSEGLLFLKTDYILHGREDFQKSYDLRIVGSKYEKQYKELLLKYPNRSEYDNV